VFLPLNPPHRLLPHLQDLADRPKGDRPTKKNVALFISTNNYLCNMKKSVLLFLFPMLLSACSNNTVFNETKTFDNSTWRRFDILWFSVPVKKGDALDFDLNFTHADGFQYDKLWVDITFYTPDGTTRSRDYDFNLKDRAGNWKGDKRGDRWHVVLPIRKDLLFNETGICKVRVENKYSKMETPGIVELGLAVRKNER